MTPDASPPFAAVFRNRNFRLLWLGQVVSQLGDWFNSVALYALLFELTGSTTSVAIVMVMQLLPIALVGPTSGVVVDRFDRRRVMITADIVRGTVVLALLLVRTPELTWIAYAATAIAVAGTGFFEPARSAVLPSIVSSQQLVAANAIATGTWSAMLAIGASLGGVVAALLGRDAAFIINSLSFFLSAFFLWRMRVPPRNDAHVAASGWHGLVEGLRYIRTHRDVAYVASIKGGWAMVGGAILLLAVFGDRVFRLGDSGDAGIGVLYAARGIGSAMGSLTVAIIATRSSSFLIRLIAPSYLAAGTAYAMLSLAPTIWVAAATVVIAHTFGSILWVSSTTLLQLYVPDNFRGRVFAAELMLLTIVQSAVTYGTALALDLGHLSPRTLAVIIGASLWIPAIAWRARASAPARSGRP